MRRSHLSLDLHASPSTDWEASLPAFLTRPRQAGRVNAQPGLSRGSWCLGEEAAAPWSQLSLLASSSSPQDPRPGAPVADGIPPADFAPPQPSGEGEEQAEQAGGKFPAPSPWAQLLRESSDLPAAAAWLPPGLGGEVAQVRGRERRSEGAGEGMGEGGGKEIGGPRADHAQMSCPSGAASPPLTRPPPRCPAWKDLSPHL